jgi:hypothetical protein
MKEAPSVEGAFLVSATPPIREDIPVAVFYASLAMTIVGGAVTPASVILAFNSSRSNNA